MRFAYQTVNHMPTTVTMSEIAMSATCQRVAPPHNSAFRVLHHIAFSFFPYES